MNQNLSRKNGKETFKDIFIVLRKRHTSLQGLWALNPPVTYCKKTKTTLVFGPRMASPLPPCVKGGRSLEFFPVVLFWVLPPPPLQSTLPYT